MMYVLEVPQLQTTAPLLKAILNNSRTQDTKKEEKIEAHFSHTCYATENPSNIFQLTNHLKSS